MSTQRQDTLHQYAKARGFSAFRLMPITAPFDGIVFNKSGIAVEIVKVKNCISPIDKYPTLKIDKDKINIIIRYGKRHNIRTVLVINWAGDIRWLNLTEIEAENGGLDDGFEPLFPEATIKSRRPGEEDRVVYQIDTLLFRPIVIQPYQVTA